jgi:hypothetical protein
LSVFLAIVAAASSPPPSEAEIVVLAQKMQFIEVDIKAPRRNGVLVLDRCRITKGSGNSELDAVPCEAAKMCMAETPASRKILELCTEDRSQVLLDEITARWRADGKVQQ